jgi:tetratricopeptide (TPR) repeat protein
MPRYLGNCSIDCIKQLLPNIAASGLWERLPGWTGAALSSVGLAGLGAGTIPLGITVACVAGYIGLTRVCKKKSEEDERHDLAAALAIIRKRTKNGDQQLADLGFHLKMNVEDIHRRFTSLDTAVMALSGKLDDLDSHFRDHRDQFDDLCQFMQASFDDLKPFISALPATLAELKQDNDEFRKSLLRIERTGVETRDLVITGNAGIVDLQQQVRALTQFIKASSHGPWTAEASDNTLENAIARLARDAELGDETARRALAEKSPEEAGDYYIDKLARMHQGRVAIVKRLDQEEIQISREAAEIFYRTGRISEAEAAVQRILELLPDDFDAIKRLGHIHELRGDLSAAERLYQRLLELVTSDASSDDGWRAVAYSNLGTVLKTRSDLDAAEAMQRKALAINEKLGRLDEMAKNYGNLGNVLQARGDLDAAESMYSKALAINERLGKLEGVANIYSNVGNGLRCRNELERAEAMYYKALAIHEKLGSLEGMAHNYGSLGSVLQIRGDLNAAGAMHSKALVINEKLGKLAGMARDYGNLGYVLQSCGDQDAAEAMYRKSLAIHQKLGSLDQIAQNYGSLGYVLQVRGDLDAATVMYDESLAIYKRLGSDRGMALQYCHLGFIAVHQKHIGEARRLWTVSRDLLAKIGNKKVEERVQRLLHTLPQ